MTLRTVFGSIVLSAAALLGGCISHFGDPGTGYRFLPADKARLVFAAAPLMAATARYRIADNPPEAHYIERGRWDTRDGIVAELMLVEARAGTRMPSDPKDLTSDFPGLIRLNAAFGDLYESETAVGTALWRRFVTGTRTCVIFRQNLTGRPKAPGARVLSGYYCASPGATFTVLDAAAILRAAGLKHS